MSSRAAASLRVDLFAHELLQRLVVELGRSAARRSPRRSPARPPGGPGRGSACRRSTPRRARPRCRRARPRRRRRSPAPTGSRPAAPWARASSCGSAGRCASAERRGRSGSGPRSSRGSRRSPRRASARRRPTARSRAGRPRTRPGARRASVKNRPRKAMSPPGSAHRQLEVLAHEVAAQQRRQPVAVGVAPDADEARGDVEHLAAAPVLNLRQTAARAVLRGRARRRRRAAPGPRSPRPRSYSCTRNSLARPPTISVRPYCATPGASIA